MKRFSLSMTALSPLAIRSDQAEGGVATTHSIPGATLLGSLAAAHLMLRPKNQDEFARFFLSEQVYFPHLYPASFKQNRFQRSNQPVLPLPRTAQTCKRFSGFLPLPHEENVDERHGVRDTLLDWGAFALLEHTQAAIPTLLTPFHEHEECTYKQGKYNNAPCGQTMDHIGGYYIRDRRERYLRGMADTNTRLQTRTGINREWGIMEERILYNREVFDEQTRFWGEVLLPDELAQDFKSFVEMADVENPKYENVVRLGTGRTRGLGRVSLKLEDVLVSKPTDFIDKLRRFDDAMQQQALTFGIQQRAPFYFALTLQAPTILCDSFLRYQKTVDADTLPALLGLPSSYSFERVYQSVGTQRVTGWNELWGTPRSHDYALEMGSTFLFACKQKPDDDFIQALRTTEEQGIGRRRAEGFGRLSFSDPFHLEREQA